MKLITISFAAAFVLVVIAAQTCPGQVNWNNTSDPMPLFQKGSNWLGGVAPTASDVARFGFPAVYDVGWNSNTPLDVPEVAGIEVNAGEVTFVNVDGLAKHELLLGAQGLRVLGSGTWLTVGGIQLNSTSDAVVGSGSSLNIDGDASFAAEVSVGNLQADGTFQVTGGSSFTTASATMATANSSIALVSGVNSQWTDSGSLVVGNAAQAFLTVTNRGRLSSNFLSVGNGPASDGHLTVTDAGSTLQNSGTLDIGVEGIGTARIQNGATANIGGGIRLGTLDSFSFGTLAIEGAGSELISSGTLAVGQDGDGAVSVTAGGHLETQSAFVGVERAGTVGVSGSGSRWDVNGDVHIRSGASASSLGIADGGMVVATGETGTSTGGSIDVSGSGSELNTNTLRIDGLDGLVTVGSAGRLSAPQISVGFESAGTATLQVTGAVSRAESDVVSIGVDGVGNANILNEGTLTADSVTLGANATSVGTMTVAGAGTEVNVAGSMNVGDSGEGNLFASSGSRVEAGNLNVGVQLTGNGTIRVSDTATQLIAGAVRVGEDGGGGLVVENGASAEIGSLVQGGASGFGSVTITGTGSSLAVASTATIGSQGGGTLRVESGGSLTTGAASIADSAVSGGDATVTGSGSTWDVAGPLYVGRIGGGSLTVSDGGHVTSGDAIVADGFGEFSFATVDGAGSRWDVLGDLTLGIDGQATLSLSTGGEVNNVNATIGTDTFSSSSISTASVIGAGTQWNNSGNLTLGDSGNAQLLIQNGGSVTVGETTTIGSAGNVILQNGNFDFGTTSLAEYQRINATGGTLAGNVIHSAFTDVASLTNFQSSGVNISGVTLENHGTFHGSASLLTGLENGLGGEVHTFAGDLMRFEGSGVNFGEIDSFGGVLRFEGSLSNEAGGFIGGNGIFIANGGIENSGVMAFTGDSNILGDVTMDIGSQLVVSGFATTTLFDDLQHNGAEIRTSNGSALVVLGEATGAGAFTGSGTVFFEGDLRPGNSPDIVSFEGNVVLGTNADTFIELGGNLSGSFDQMLIGGDFDIAGDLSVNLINGFELAANEQFLIADVEGSMAGMFGGLNENALVGNFGGRDLFITYNGFSGNAGVGLFTAVPEPNSGLIFGTVALLLVVRRRR